MDKGGGHDDIFTGQSYNPGLYRGMECSDWLIYFNIFITFLLHTGVLLQLLYEQERESKWGFSCANSVLSFLVHIYIAGSPW
jgi:hypothetical protein